MTAILRRCWMLYFFALASRMQAKWLCIRGTSQREGTGRDLLYFGWRWENSMAIRRSSRLSRCWHHCPRADWRFDLGLYRREQSWHSSRMRLWFTSRGNNPTNECWMCCDNQKYFKPMDLICWTSRKQRRIKSPNHHYCDINSIQFTWPNSARARCVRLIVTWVHLCRHWRKIGDFGIHGGQTSRQNKICVRTQPRIRIADRRKAGRKPRRYFFQNRKGFRFLSLID